MKIKMQVKASEDLDQIALKHNQTVACGLRVKSSVKAGFNPQPDPPRFGIVGMGRDQAAILNVVLVELPPDPDVPPDPGHPGCLVELSFVGADGRTLQDAAGHTIKWRTTLHGSVAQRLAFRGASVMGENQARLPIRAVVEHPPDPDSDCNGLIATVELVAPNGWTVLTQAGIAWGGPTEPAPEGAAGR